MYNAPTKEGVNLSAVRLRGFSHPCNVILPHNERVVNPSIPTFRSPRLPLGERKRGAVVPRKSPRAVRSKRSAQRARRCGARPRIPAPAGAYNPAWQRSRPRGNSHSCGPNTVHSLSELNKMSKFYKHFFLLRKMHPQMHFIHLAQEKMRLIALRGKNSGSCSLSSQLYKIKVLCIIGKLTHLNISLILLSPYSVVYSVIGKIPP